MDPPVGLNILLVFLCALVDNNILSSHKIIEKVAR